MTVTASRERLDSLTATRFAAALSVFIFHAIGFTAGNLRRGLGDLFGHGGSAVSFFFVLSGFVLTWSRRPQDHPLDVWLRRAARIVPACLVAWVATGILTAAGVIGGGTLTVHSVPGATASLLLVQAWIPRSAYYWGWNPVAWSLSCEVFFYLVFPFLVPRVSSLSRQGRIRVAAGAAGLTVGLDVAAVWLTRPEVHGVDGGLDTYGWFVHVCPVGRLPEFVLGMALALLVRDTQIATVPLGGAALVLLGGYALGYASPYFVTTVAFVAAPSGLLITALAQRDLRGGRPVPRFAVALGEWSYAFYLLHLLIIDTVLRWQGTLNLVSLAATLVAVWACSVLMYRLVERPLERRLRPAERRLMLLA